MASADKQTDILKHLREDVGNLDCNHKAPVIPRGWTLDRTNSGDIIVRKAGIGGWVSSAHSDNIASSILHELAADILATASGGAECGAYQGNQETQY